MMCKECTDDRKDKPRSWAWRSSVAPRRPRAGRVEGSKILDPENSRNYTLRLHASRAAKEMVVAQAVVHTQTWTRVRQGTGHSLRRARSDHQQKGKRKPCPDFK